MSEAHIELTIDSLAPGGAGIARLTDNTGGRGKVFFVDGGYPGERVQALVTADKGGHAFARALRIPAPSRDRREAECPHFGLRAGSCGGCSWQDLSRPAQLAAKTAIVVEQLTRLGRIPDAATLVRDCRSVSPDYFYRNKMEFVFLGDGRDQGGALHLGLRERLDPGRVLDVADCRLQSERCMRVVAVVRETCRELGLSAWSPPSGQQTFRRPGARPHAKDGWLRFLVVRESGDQLLIQLIAGPARPGRENEASAGARRIESALRDAFGHDFGFAFALRFAPAQVALADKTLWTTGPDSLTETLNGLRLTLSADAFFQTNSAGAAALYAQVADRARLAPGQTAWDLYCGVGGVALTLAGRFPDSRVLGVEASQVAIRDAKANAAANAIANCRFQAASAEGFLFEQSRGPDLLLVDPPRAGLSPEVTEDVLRLGPPRLLYVSCDPATLARDLARLATGYRLAAVQPLDMFPQTPHVECVAELEKR